MAKLNKEKVRNPKVSIAAIAIDEGYHKNRIVRIGEKFLYDGEFSTDSEGEYVLPFWMEAQNNAELVKLSKAAKAAKAPTKEKAPATKPAAKPANAAAVMGEVEAAAPELV